MQPEDAQEGHPVGAPADELVSRRLCEEDPPTWVHPQHGTLRGRGPGPPTRGRTNPAPRAGGAGAPANLPPQACAEEASPPGLRALLCNAYEWRGLLTGPGGREHQERDLHRMGQEVEGPKAEERGGPEGADPHLTQARTSRWRGK